MSTKPPPGHLHILAVRGRVDPDTPFFARGVIGSDHTGRVFEFEEWDEDGVDGTTFTPDDLRGAHEGGELTYLPKPLVRPCWKVEAWIFADREAARRAGARLVVAGAWIHTLPDGEGTIIVVQGNFDHVRRKLAVRAGIHAEEEIFYGVAEDALKAALVAWHYAQTGDALATGALVAAYRIAGDDARADFHLRAAKNTHGQGHTAAVEARAAWLVTTREDTWRQYDAMLTGRCDEP